MNIKKDEIVLDKNFPFKLLDNTMPPFFNMDRVFHWHDCLEISYVKSGRGRYHIGDKSFEMEPGDIIIINNVEPHYLEVYDESMHQPVIIFEPSLIWSQSNCNVDYEYLSPFFERGSDFNNKLDLSNAFAFEIKSNLLATEDEYEKKPQGYKLMIKDRLLMILTFLIRYFRDKRKNHLDIPSKRQQLIRLEEIIRYISENFDRNIMLEEVYAKLYMTPQYFSTYFKKVLGVNFVGYLNNLRANRAIELLRETDMKITRIAMECGFNNTTTFNSIFKKFTGKTPSEYRRQG